MDCEKMDCEKINKVCRMDDFLPTKKISELDVQKDYKVTAFKSVTTKFGLKTMVVIEDEFTIFLPSRISKAFNDDQEQLKMHEDAAAENRLHLRYLGGKYNQCEFIYDKTEN